MKRRKVAVVGFGFMGRMHYGCWKKVRSAEVVAVCDSNLAAIRNEVKGNIAMAGDSSLDPAVRVFGDFGDMLRESGADVVDLTLPTFLHPAMVEQALKAGKHVLCEKPMAISSRECDRMLKAADRSSGKLMIAQCLRFWPEYVWLREAVESGRFGKVVAAEFTRIGAAPGWNSGGRSWFLDESKSGGMALDLHIHDVDIVNCLFGIPPSVTSRSHRRDDGVMDHITTIYNYPDKVVTATACWAATSSFSFGAAFRVAFERATVIYDSRLEAGHTLTVYPCKGRVTHPRLSSRSGYENEIRWFLDYINGKSVRMPLTPLDARNSVALVEMELRKAEPKPVSV